MSYMNAFKTRVIIELIVGGKMIKINLLYMNKIDWKSAPHHSWNRGLLSASPQSLDVLFLTLYVMCQLSALKLAVGVNYTETLNNNCDESSFQLISYTGIPIPRNLHIYGLHIQYNYAYSMSINEAPGCSFPLFWIFEYFYCSKIVQLQIIVFS